MEKIYKQYKDGEISRKDVYKRAAEILTSTPEKVEFVYEEYFKPSEEECFENVTESCNAGNYMLIEEEKFEEFIFYISNNNEEKIREIKELITTSK